MKWKLFGAAAVAAVVSVCASTASASAASIPAFEPLTTNVPYLAWRGEEVRLVKCLDVQSDGGDAMSLVKGNPFDRFSADWLVEDWSGYPFDPPQLEPSTVKFFWGTGEYYRDPCVKADFVSLKAGLAQIKLVITDNKTGDPVLKHQYLAGWLSLNTPSIREVSATTTPGGGGVLGDPAGDGNFVAGGSPGRVQVQVTGNLPLGNNFTELGLPASINLPTESNGSTYWDDLAKAMATTSDARPIYRDAPWKMWDIHDDQAATEGHVTVQPCNWTNPLTAIDAVDACLGAENFYGDGGYSRAFGDLSAAPTWGPFDPLRPDETLLSDGKLDQGDVPMPSAIVEVGITPNSGAAGDISGVGSLAVTGPNGPLGVYKCLVYSRDHRCTSQTGPHPATTPNVLASPPGPAAHNHYAPYYSRWIPATYARIGENGPPVTEASGNDGPAIGNNFPGYRGSGLYDYWQFADILSTAQDGPTHCLRRTNYGDPEYRHLPVGPQRVLVFSDEHGEAQVYFNPGTGFYFDNLVTPNENGGCDLRGITTLGTATIGAVARYPYQKTTDPDKPSATITKRVGSLFNKSVTCHPKAGLTGPEAGTSWICDASAIDIDGTPFAGEKVCFMTGGAAEGLRSFPLGTPSTTEGIGRLCVRTDANGHASVEIFGKCGAGNVIAEFVDEGIIRVATWTFGCPTGGGTTTTTTTTSTSTTTTTTSSPGALTPPAPAAVISQAIARAESQPAVTPTGKTAKATLVVVRIQKQAFAKTTSRNLLVRVNAQAKTAQIRITLVNRSGKVVRTVTRVIQTNRLVRVANLTLPKAAATARVKVLT